MYKLYNIHMSSREMPDFSLTRMTVPEVLDRFDGLRVRGTDNQAMEWGGFMHFNGLFEYPTIEYMDVLSEYLATRSAEIADVKERPARIVEVAAGTGYLSSLLNESLQTLGADATLVTSDDDSWNSRGTVMPHVLRESYVDTIRRERPDIIIGGWLPADFTRDFRNPGDDIVPAEEYLLIGNTEHYAIHAGRSAWGRDDQDQPVAVPEYTRDGYTKTHFGEWREFQLCYRSVAGRLHSSETVSFRNN